MITEEQVEAACDYLRDNAEPSAHARANRVYLEAYVKTVLAQEMKRHADLSVSAQEREGRTAEPYLASLDALRSAVFEDERQRFLREAAQAKIEAWRTLEATRRAEGKAY
jgi:hypothetical protein